MNLCKYTTLTTLILTAFSFAPISTYAQTCGNIITPVNYYFEGSGEQLNPIQNCNNPLERTGDLTTFRLNNQSVQNNATYIISEEGTDDYGIGEESYFLGSGATYYKHSGQDLIRVNANYFEPVRSDIETALRSYFNNNESQVQKYTEIYLADYRQPYFYDDTLNQYYYDVVAEDLVWRVYAFAESHIEQNVETKRPALSPGTYTVVQIDTDEGVFPTFEPSLLQRLFATIIPTAHAYYYVNTVTFTLAGPAPAPTGASSVLFLPGIQASRLYKDGLAGTEDQIWVPDGNQDVRQLKMNTNGVSQYQVYTRNILEELPYTGETVYDSFSQSMINLMFDGVIKAWAPYAYDWRYSVGDIAINGTKYEQGTRKAVDIIQTLASSSFTGKVTIIGHSNGGLLAKVIVKQLEQEGKANLVDKVILLASPQLGTPKAIGTILHGYDQEKLGGWAIDDEAARDVIQNMPGAYGLVTSQSYFNNSADKVIKFENSTTTQSFRTVYGEAIDSEEELRRFMIGNSDNRAQATTIDEVLRANETMLNSELDLHANTLDNWVAPAGIDLIEVVGTGLDTVSGFEYRSFRERVCSVFGVLFCETKDFYKPVPLVSQNGDKTVMVQSAEGYVGTKQKYFIDLNAVEDGGRKEEHYNISENPSIQKLIKNILLATTTDIEFISTTNNYDSSDRVLLGSHSPVDIEVVASNGNRVGRTVVNGVPGKEESIPGSTYFEIGTSKYIIVPADANYNIKLTGTGEGGLTFTLDKLNNNTQIPAISVRVATVTASTSIKIGYVNNLVSNLEIDSNGDSIIDTILTPQGADVTPKITYKNLKDKINSFSLSAVRKLPLLLLADTADILNKKSIINPKLVLVKIFTLNQLEALAISYHKKRWITQSNLDDIRFIIGKLK